jgi:hypothetical protein
MKQVNFVARPSLSRGSRLGERFASHVRSSRRHEHRSLVQLAAGLTALSRCAIPHKVVTTERVAKSHNNIRSSRLAVHVAMSAWAKGWSGPPRCSASIRRVCAELPAGRTDARRRSEPPRSLIKRRRAGGCRPWPDRGSPCSRRSAAQRRTMPDRPGGSPHARQWY